MYGVTLSKKTDTFSDWFDTVKPLVIGYPGVIYKKFQSTKFAEEFVKVVGIKKLEV